MKKILLLVDFTGVCQLAMEHVAIIARQSLCQVTLLHIAATGGESSEKEIKQEVRDFAKLLDDEGIPFNIHVDYGDFFQIVGDSITKLNADLIIVGTHGIKGIKQNFVGSNILRLIQLIEIPALVVQGHSETPMEGYLKILVPLLAKQPKMDITEPITMFGEVFNSKIHCLMYYHEQSESDSKKHGNELQEKFIDRGMTVEIDQERTSLYTNNYYRSIIEYADIEEAQLIALVISKKGGDDYFDTTDQENLLLNRLGKPVLCL